MARKISSDESGRVYRAVLVWRNHDGDRTYTDYEGPYGSIGAARARVTFWKNTTRTFVEGWVESSETTWTRLSSG